MAVIKEIKNGSGGVIRIHDDYCKNNTPEDNQKIIDNISRIVNDYYIRKSVGQRRRIKMQKNLIISLITGQLVALLPLWDWGDKLTFLTGSICITIVAMITITWLEDKTRTIKRALTSANVKGLRN